jgi:hypothetical protein
MMTTQANGSPLASALQQKAKASQVVTTCSTATAVPVVEAVQGGLVVMPTTVAVQAGRASSTHSAASPLSLQPEVEGVAAHVKVQALQTAQVLVFFPKTTMAMQELQTRGGEAEVHLLVSVAQVDLGLSSCVTETHRLPFPCLLQSRRMLGLGGLLTSWHLHLQQAWGKQKPSSCAAQHQQP